MCHLKYLRTITAFFVWVGILVSLVQAEILGPKVWIQTTEKDFGQGQLDSVAITRLEDGEVQLPHPLVRTRNDSIDNSVLRFAVYDEFGNYLKLWTQDTQLFAEKYAPDGQVLIERFQVNTDTLEEKISYYAGCFNDMDHGFIILWSGELKVDEQDYIFAQFYDSTGTPIGRNQMMNETAMNQGSKPSAIFDDYENYWIFWDQGDWNKGALYYQKYSSSGEKIGSNQQLNPENYFKHEFYPLVAKNSRGEFVVAWSTIVDNIPSSNYFDAYLRFFNKEGLPKGPPIRVDDDPGEFRQQLTDICVDHHDNLLLVWIDRRGITDGNFAQVYAQLYNADGVPLNRNRQIAAVNPYHDGGSRAADIVLLPDGQFQISWKGSHMGSPPTSEIVVNQWKIDRVRDGELTSSIFDVGPGGADWQTINWSEEGDTNITSIRFKIRSSQTLQAVETADWFGPTSTAEFYTASAAQPINSIHDGDRYVQYKAFLDTQIPGTTPILKDVSLWFTTLDSIAPQTPKELSTQEDIHQIRVSWSANNEPDLKMYRLYRGRASQDYNIYWTKEINATLTSYVDTNVVPGTSYFYAISAVDSNLNESPLSADVFDSPLGRLYYVDDLAEPGGNGSFGHPFSTISTGLQRAMFGDTVKVLPGSYAGPVIIGKGVALVGAGSHFAMIEGPSDDIVVQCGDSSLVKGFTIINNSERSAIRCERASPIITENVLINYGGDYAIGIHQLRYSSPQVTKNIISSFGTAILDYYGYEKKGTGFVRNNIFFDCKQKSISLGSSNTQILNNTIVQNEGMGIRFRESVSNVMVMNNIIYLKNQESGTGIHDSYNGSITCQYNNIIAEKPYSGCEPGEGSISAVPLFHQERPYDFRLQPDSPGVDAGHPAPEFNDPDGSRNDMGAFGGPDPIDANMFIENATSIMVNNASGFPADTITASISLSNLAGVCQIQFDLTYDENLLDAFDVSNSEITSNFQLDWEESSGGKVTVSMESTSEIIKGSGKIVTIHFAVDSACVAGAASPLSLENIHIGNCAGAPFRILQVTDGAFIVHVGSVGGRYVFVDQNNSGFEDGSHNHPYRTISHGILQASAGDTVLVSAGDYNEKLEMRDNVFVKGMGSLVTRLFAQETPVVFNGINQSGISGFTLESSDGGIFTIECLQSSPIITKNKIICGEGMGVGILCHDSSPVIFNNFFQSKGDGLWILCFASNPHILLNSFYAGDYGFSGIDCNENSKPIIERNTFHGAQHGGNIIRSTNASPQIMCNKFYCGSFNGTGIEALNSSELQIFNNVILVDGFECYGIKLNSCQDVKIVNNTIYSDSCIVIFARQSSMLNMNNIFVGFTFQPFDITEPQTVTYSAFWDFLYTMTDTVAGIGNIVVDPQFVSLDEQNFQLAPNSPCINAGNPAAEYNDLDGSRNDMGVYGGPFADSSSLKSLQAILSISSVEAAPGSLAVLPVESYFVAGVAEIKLTIGYDQSILSVEDVNTADLTKSFSLTADFSGNDSVAIALVSPVGINSEQGSLIQVIFKVNADADTGKSTSVSIKRALLRSEVSETIMVGEMNSGHITISGGTSVVPQNQSERMPRDFQLSQNYPNPFNSETRIRYGIPNQKVNYNVSIRIYNILGQLTRELFHKTQSPGYHTIRWDGKDDLENKVPSGIYVCVFKAGDVRRVRKMLVLR